LLRRRVLSLSRARCISARGCCEPSTMYKRIERESYRLYDESKRQSTV
jgi:hypothetical protein